MTRLPLRAAAVPLRLTGQWPVTAWRLRRWAREQPWARRLVQRLRDARSGPA
jgi:hypothetical protein